jgi:signal transduction histidine kinase
MPLLEKIKNYLREKPLRLTRIIILFTGVVLAFSYYSFFRSSMEDVRQTASSLRLGIIETSRAQVESFIEDNAAALADLAQKIDIAADPQEKKDFLENFLRERGWFTQLTIADREGNEEQKISKIFVAGSQELGNVREMEGFQKASTGSIFFGKVSADEKSVPYITIGLPVGSAQNSVSRVLLAQLSLQEIWNIIQNSKLVSTDQKVFLVDSSGFLIAYPEAALVLKKMNWKDKPYVREVLENGNIVGGEIFSENGNNPVFVAGLPMSDELGWGIFIKEPAQVALASYYRIQTAAVIFILLTFLLLFILIIHSGTLAGVFSDFKNEAAKRAVELKELDQTTKLLIRRDLELSEANRKLEEMDIVKSDFVSIAAHQLRTPLTGIKWSFLALLERETGLLNPEQRKIVEDGLVAINHTINLINDLLNVAHIEEGRFGFNFQRISILPIVRKAFERFQSSAGAKGVWFSIELPSREPPPLSLDPEKIDLVLDNLLENAIKYTQPGGKVKIKLDYEKGKVKIIISDTGIGVPKRQFGRVFSKFFRGENALLFQTSGTGLGLYMVKNIIDRHCGQISVESEEGKGTTFTIILETNCKL